MRNARWILIGLLTAGCASTQTTENKQVLRAGYESLNAQDYEGAMARSQEFLENNPYGGPGTPEALYLQGRVYEQKAVTADAAHNDAQARADLLDARTTYEHALTLGPAPKLAALLHAGVANTAYFQDDYLAAIREWTTAYPGLAQADAKAWVLYRVALSQQRLGHFEDADRSFLQVVKDYPHSEPAQRAATHQGARAFYVQIGSYAGARNADAVLAGLRLQGFTAEKKIEANGRQAIAVGPAKNYEQAKTLRARLASAYPAAIIEP